MRFHHIRATLLAAVAVVAACGGRTPETLVLASTTSTEDSGLFDEMIPAFEKAHPEYRVKVVAVGTGQALELGRRRDADVLLVHAPPAESAFVAEGYGVERRRVMYNDFVIVGPPGDPAGLRGTSDPAAALRRIADTASPFVSRGDDSGTHKKERALWQDAGVAPSGEWYVDAGQGMGDVLMLASEKEAYTLSDRATYLNMRDRLALDVMVEGDPRLFNQYGVIPVTGAHDAKGAKAFEDWIVSKPGQELIGRYGVERFGKALFTPNADAQ